MKKHTFYVVLLLNLILLNFAQADTVNLKKSTSKKQTKIVNIDLMPYLNFVQEWTSYKYNGEPLPVVKIERHELVQIFAYGEITYAQAEQKGKKLPTVNAIYLIDTKTIYISDKIDINSDQVKITLVHELVHYMQDITGYTKSLNGYIACTESEAYDVQMLWQHTNKVDVESIPFVYQQSLISATKCMGSKTSVFSKSSRFNFEQ